MINEQELRQQICQIGQRMYNKDMAAANDGNISARLNDREWLCTPTGVSKGFMTPDILCKVDANGNVIHASGNHRPSCEIKMHMRVYEKRDDVNAVVHAHPAYATTFAVAGIPLTKPITPEAVMFLGYVPIAKYGTPSTTEIPDNIEEFLPHHDAILLESHGALTWGHDVTSAYNTMESLEFYARLLYQSQLLGGAKELTPAQVQQLHQVRRSLGLRGRNPGDVT